MITRSQLIQNALCAMAVRGFCECIPIQAHLSGVVDRSFATLGIKVAGVRTASGWRAKEDKRHYVGNLRFKLQRFASGWEDPFGPVLVSRWTITPVKGVILPPLEYDEVTSSFTPHRHVDGSITMEKKPWLCAF